MSSDAKSGIGSLFWNSVFLSLGIFIGRITGFLRDVTVAAVYGADKEADVAVLILTIPDLLIGILVGGGLSAAFIPEFNKNAGKHRISLFWQGSLISLAGFSFVTLILTFVHVLIYQMLAPGLDQAQVQTSSGILFVALWVIPVTVLAGMTTAYLNAQNRFVITSLGTAILNLVIIAALIWIQFYGEGMIALGWAIVVGGVIRWMSQMLAMRETFSFRDCFNEYLLHFDLFKRYSHVLLAGAVLVLFPVLARGVASMYEPGSIAIINYSWKLIQFPLGAGVGVIAVVLFPYISRSFENDESDKGSEDTIIIVFEVVLILCVCIMLPMIIFSRDFSEICFYWGGNGRGKCSPNRIAYWYWSAVSSGARSVKCLGCGVQCAARYLRSTDNKSHSSGCVFGAGRNWVLSDAGTGGHNDFPCGVILCTVFTASSRVIKQTRD